MIFIDEYIEFFYEEMGPAKFFQRIPEKEIEKYKGKLPDTLLSYWREYGWCGYGNGIFWTVNPEEYSSVVNEWLAGTEFSNIDNYHLVAISGFGKMFLWGENTGNSLSITCSHGFFVPNDKTDFIKSEGGSQDLLVKSFFSGVDKNLLDISDVDNKPLFDRSVALYGELRPREIYGFVPSVMMGGEQKIENVKRVDSVSYLMLLAGLGEKKIL